MLVIEDNQYNVLCLGLSGAGKSTLLAQLVGDPVSQIEPTNGFNIKTLPFKNSILSVKEVGGSVVVKPFWDQYFGDKHGILFVVDASASEKDLDAARETLRVVLLDQRLEKKPCLVLGTHSDLKEARQSEELEAFFSTAVLNRRWALACCSAYDSEQIQNAFDLLIELIVDKPV